MELEKRLDVNLESGAWSNKFKVPQNTWVQNTQLTQDDVPALGNCGSRGRGR